MSTLAAGSTLGHYRILGLIGAGGMGEVYEASDPRINRRVAVKILPRALAADADRVRRFQQEARAAGALNHPNLLSLFDLGEQDGLHFLVTELLTGESLRARLGRGPLTPRHAVEVAQQIAEGLAAAHERGIVHRDLKPENVFLTADGRVKILDFGLAKLVGLDSDPAWASRTGMVVGTAAYMAPEQIRGEDADGRADLFALGAILYELLTGTSAFRRETTIATLNAVIGEEPALLASVQSGVPSTLMPLLAGCLEKDVARRFQSARDLAIALRSLVGPPSLPVTEVGIKRPQRRQPLPRWAVPAAVAAATLVLGFAVGLLSRGETPHPPPTLRHLTRSVDDSAPALSPDGRSLAFVSKRDGTARVWVKELTGGGEAPLTGGPDLFPRFSPDGSELLFVRFDGDSGALTKVPFPGGAPRTLLRDVFDADWSPDGERIAFVRHHNVAQGSTTEVGILVPASGQARAVARAPGLLYQPRWSPDGTRLAAVSAGGTAVVLVDLGDGSVRSLAPPPPARTLSTAAWDGPHHLLALRAEGSDPGVATTAGSCVRLDVRDGSVETLFWTPNWGQHLDARDGRVVFSAGSSRQALWEAEVGPDGALARGRWLTRGASIDRQPAYSPDGAWIAFSSDRSGNLDLWKLARAGGDLVRLTDDPGVDWDPAFLADGRLVWSSDRGGGARVWIAAADGSAAGPLTPPGQNASNPVPTPDGEWILFVANTPAARGLWRIRPDGSGAARLLAGALQLPAIAPDGRRLALLEHSARDPKAAALRVLTWPDATPVLTLPLSPQSLVELPISGRARFWGGARLVYLGSGPQGRPRLLAHDLTDGGEPLALTGYDPALLPESFAFGAGGGRLVLSLLDLQQNLLIADFAPKDVRK